jgi:hypothetical protein
VWRFASLALAAALLLAASACAGDDQPVVTLTGDDCVYEGPGSVDAGTFSLDIENESDEVGVFALVRIEPGSTPGELDAFIAEAQSGGPSRRTPEFVTVVIEVEVNPQESSPLDASLVAGHHAVICSTGATEEPPTSVHATESFEVT